MSIMHARYLNIALFFIFIFLSGFWVMFAGKPYNVIIFTIHKLFAIAAVVFLVITVSQVNRVAPLSSVEIVAVVITGLLFLLTILSGGLLSVGTIKPTAMQIVHRIAPYLTLLCTFGTLYLLYRHKS